MSVVITENITCEPINGASNKLREMFLLKGDEEAYEKFNELINAVGKECFEAGRNYEAEKRR